MKSPTFRGKPSETHVIWRDGAGAGAAKTFDEEELRGWCSVVGADFETGKRVDHRRGDDTRRQYRCVFTWSEGAGESFSMGDDEWEIEMGKTPETFVEIDERGTMRVEGPETERIVDVEELWLDDWAMVFRGADIDGTKRIDARSLKPE